MTKLIGFSGFAGSGKSTAASYLHTAHNFTRFRFAGPLKDMMRALGLGEAEVDGHLKETPSAILGGKTPRFAMQTLGTEWGRALIHSNLWVMAAMDRAETTMRSGQSVCIDDVRFPNEVEAIKAAGGTVIRITRAGVGPQSSHASEPTDLPFDIEIFNDLTMDSLYDQLDSILGELK